MRGLRLGGHRARWWVLPALVLMGPLLARGETAKEVAVTAPSSASMVGVVVASQSVAITARVQGRLKELKVDLGDKVAMGQALLLLEQEPFQLEVAARQAHVQAVVADLQRQEVLLAQARQRLAREQRIRDFTAAEALETAENDVALAAANLAIGQAKRSEAQARLALALRDLESATVRAPFAGFITERYQSPGAQVGLGTPLMRLVSDELRLRFAIPEAAAPSVRKGLQVSVYLPVLGATLEAQVENVAPEVDTATRHQKAEARLLIPEALRAKVAVGLLAEVSLPPEPVTSSRRAP